MKETQQTACKYFFSAQGQQLILSVAASRLLMKTEKEGKQDQNEDFSFFSFLLSGFWLKQFVWKNSS